jgi:hypothetical protein
MKKLPDGSAAIFNPRTGEYDVTMAGVEKPVNLQMKKLPDGSAAIFNPRTGEYDVTMAGVEKPVNFQMKKLPDGSMAIFNPRTGKYNVEIEGIEKVPPEYQSALKKAYDKWTEYATGGYGDPNSPAVQGLLKNAWDAVGAMRARIAEAKKTPIAPAGRGFSTSTNTPIKVGRFTIIPQ